MAVDDACDDDRRDGDPVRDLLQERARGAQGGAFDVRAGVAVGHDRDDEVHAGVDALQQEERLGIFLRVLQFGDEAEKRDVAGVGEDDVRSGQESRGKVGFHRDVDFLVAWFFDAHADHGD